MQKIIIALTVILLLVVSLACSSASRSVAPGQEGSPGQAVPARPAAPAATPAPSGVSGSRTSITERMVVRTGDMALLVEDIASAIESITGIAERADGYVVASRTWREGDRLKGTISIRIAAEEFNNVIRSITGLAVEVVSQNSSSKDVTEEYSDHKALLYNLEATEQQLLRIMARAEKIEDVLAVQREISKVRGEIEQTKGKLQYLERTSATSLLEVRLDQSKLDVKFTADKRIVETGERIRFSPQVIGGFAPYNYQWDFGDGNTAIGMAPSHSYRSSGNYTVAVKVTDDRGNTDSQTMDEYINVTQGWNPVSVFNSAWNGLLSLGIVVVDILIWVGVFSPVWLIIGGIAYLGYRRRKRS